MTLFTNRAISASAGTGKTFRLAHRYIGLMAADQDPDRICALTFSRKAAGEIFDKIVERLCAAAEDAKARERTAELIRREGFPDPGPADAYVAFLRRLLDRQHRLRIGTLDSFLLSVARAFPFELGIPPDTQPVDSEGGEAMSLRQRILTEIADPTRNGYSAAAVETLDLFRQVYYGQEKKALSTGLDEQTARYHELYLRHRPPAWRWGDGERIWPSDARWWENPALSAATAPPDAEKRLETAFGSAGRAAELGAACAQIFARARAHAAGQAWPKWSETVVSQLWAAAPRPTPPTLRYHQKEYPVPDDLWPALRGALAHALQVEIGVALERTRGLQGLLERYDRLYAERMRAEGLFTFDDLARLLGEGGRPPSRHAAAPDRLFIDFRLDGRLDHWLLDEFQDTSNAQWSALANLIDEIVQGDDRSFFYVGDVKQSIYGWRGGNHRLFDAVLERYRGEHPRAIRLEQIAECHRSLPAVIEAVNRVFKTPERWNEELGGAGPREEAVRAFAAAWSPHRSARQGEGEGFAALYEYARDSAASDDAEDAGDPAEFEAVARLLERIRPIERGLTAAVLVRTNKAGRACAETLRRRLPDQPVLHEGVGGICDHPVVTLLLALARYAAHPGDTVALRHLQMSPLAARPELQEPDRLAAALLTEFHESGFAGALRAWGARLGDIGPFGAQRLRELLVIAEQYDAGGDRDPDGFVDYVETYQTRSPVAADAVRVMTVHQAKGLGFDVVIVPFSPSAKGFERPGDPKLIAGDGWALIPPVLQALEAAGGSPLDALEKARAEANFAQLCVLYVALTRAQRALYLLIPEKGRSASTVREADLLRARLAEGTPVEEAPGLRRLFAKGDPDAYGSPTPPPRAPRPSAPPRIAWIPEWPRREPSKERGAQTAMPAAWLLDPESGDRRAFGSAIHRLFEAIEWLEDADLERILETTRAEIPAGNRLRAEVERQFRSCCADPEIRRRLSRPADAPRAEVWRETSFDVVLQGERGPEIVAGRFDRLVVERDAAGAPLRATVVDFKSNIVGSEAEILRAAREYGPQMRDYRRAAAKLLGLPLDAVRAALIFTRPARVIAADDP